MIMILGVSRPAAGSTSKDLLCCELSMYARVRSAPGPPERSIRGGGMRPMGHPRCWALFFRLAPGKYQPRYPVLRSAGVRAVLRQEDAEAPAKTFWDNPSVRGAVPDTP